MDDANGENADDEQNRMNQDYRSTKCTGKSETNYSASTAVDVPVLNRLMLESIFVFGRKCCAYSTNSMTVTGR